jgi:hypothetical protein
MEKNKMEIKEVQRIETKSIPISIRTYPSYSKWMKENNVSPNAVFDKALKELMKGE